MPRSGRLRNFICEVYESPRGEKISFIPPFLIFFLEIVLLLHALSDEYVRNDLLVIELTLLLVAISLIEIVFVAREIHQHYTRSVFDRILTIRLDDFILKKRPRNVKQIVEEFIQKYPQYKEKRNQIYHISCQILETHREEAFEDKLFNELETFIKKEKYKTVDSILSTFLKKNPEYKKKSDEVYRAICQILEGP